MGLSLRPSGETSAKELRQRLLKEAVGKSRRDAMFIEKLESIDLGEPIYGRTIVGCAPKGAPTSRLCLPFYRHFTATRKISLCTSPCSPCLLRNMSKKSLFLTCFISLS